MWSLELLFSVQFDARSWSSVPFLCCVLLPPSWSLSVFSVFLPPAVCLHWCYHQLRVPITVHSSGSSSVSTELCAAAHSDITGPLFPSCSFKQLAFIKMSKVPHFHQNVRKSRGQVRKVVSRKHCFKYGNTRVGEKKSKRRNLSPWCNYFWNLKGPSNLSVCASVSSKTAFLLPLCEFMIYCLVTDNHYQ